MIGAWPSVYTYFRENINQFQHLSQDIHFKIQNYSFWGTKRRGGVRGMWLVQSVEHVTLDFRVVSSSPTLGIKLIVKKRGGVEVRHRSLHLAAMALSSLIIISS